MIRDALITAFATASSFVVIPLVAEASKRLLEPHVSDREDADAFVNISVPASHTFPHAAKILTLSFILFAGWFSDDPVQITEYPLLAVSGIASTFASVNAAIPFLLDLMRLPQDLFRLFLPIEEFSRLANSYPNRLGAGPFRVESPLFLLVSNGVWVFELLARALREYAVSAGGLSAAIRDDGTGEPDQP